MLEMKLEFFNAQTLDEASELMCSYGPNAAILAGGTDLIVRLKENLLQKKYLINIKGVGGLDQITVDEASVRIGTLVTHTALSESDIIGKHFACLAEAASYVGARQTRNVGTIGGNLCNSAPSAETAPALLALRAKVNVFTPDKKQREIPIEEFFTGPSKNVLQLGEIVKEIVIPLPPDNKGDAYLKLGKRNALEIAIVGVAAQVIIGDDNYFKDVRIALGAVAPTPIRAWKAERVLIGQKIDDDIISEAAIVAQHESQPISDIRASSIYRRQMVRVLVIRALNRALARGKSLMNGEA